MDSQTWDDDKNMSVTKMQDALHAKMLNAASLIFKRKSYKKPRGNKIPLKSGKQ